jgi:predicted transcriptional regulator
MVLALKIEKKPARSRRNRLELYYITLKYCNTINEQHHDIDQINSELLISFTHLNEYILTLQEAGLLEITHYDKTIKTTLKGIEFVRRFDFLTQQLKSNEKKKKNRGLCIN